MSSPTKFLFLPHLLDNKEATRPLGTAECYFSSRPMNIIFPCQTGIFPHLPRCPNQNPRGQLFTPQLPSPTVAAYPESNSSHSPNQATTSLLNYSISPTQQPQYMPPEEPLNPRNPSYRAELQYSGQGLHATGLGFNSRYPYGPESHQE